MQIGQTKVVIRPAMFVLIGSIVFGLVAVAAAGWYALGPKQSHGWASPKRWTYGSNGGASATMKMLSPAGTKELVTTREGYSHVDTDDGFEVTVVKQGAAPNSVYIRNAIDFDKEVAKGDLEFTFQGKSSTAFPLTFTIRDSQVKKGGGLLWSHTFNVSGDWTTYSEKVPESALGHGKIQFMVIAGHLGAKPGSVSLRNIYLK